MSLSPQPSAPSSSLSSLPIETTYSSSWQHPPSPDLDTSKRSRISRACDACRKMKIKCDVNNYFPCTTCQQYNRNCTFNEKSRKRGPPKGYIGSLEERLERMEKLLNKIQGNGTENDEPATNSATSTPSLQSYDHTPIANSTTSPSSTENSTPRHRHDSSTGRVQGDSSLSSKGKVVRYIGSSSGLYLVNDILQNQAQPSNSADTSSVLAPFSSSSPTTTNTKYGATGAGSSHGTMLPEKRLPSNQLTSQPLFKRPIMREINTKPTNSTATQSPSTYDSTFTSFETNQGTCRLRRVNGIGNDLVLVRDETEDETKIQAKAANEQEHMDSIVPRSMIASLLKVYFDADCKTLPILDQEEFMASFEGVTTPPPAPLLTYAICSFACFLVPSHHPIFTRSGLNRNDIFQAIIDRVGVFMRSEYLIPKIQTIQALVLLCAHPTYASKTNRNWVLAGMAVRMAQDLGLHRLVTNDGCTPATIEKRRRLWYSVYITDRWCCCVLGRPLAITDSDCDVDLPSMDTVDQPGKHAMFVNLVKLSGILGEILRRIYSSKAKSMGYGTHIMEQTVWSLDKMLTEWFSQVPSEYLITPEQLLAMKGVEHANGGKFSLGGPLTVCYYAVVILLFRPFLVFEDCRHHNSKLFDDAPKRCMDAATNSIDVARYIPKEQIPQFGWNFAAYSVYQAALIHVYNCTNADRLIAQTSRNYTRIAIGECMTPISEDIPFGPPILQFLKILINWTKADSSCDRSSPSKKAVKSTTGTIGIGESKASHNPSGPPNSLQHDSANLFYPSGPPMTHTPSGASATAHHLVNDSIPNVNLLSSTLSNNIYTSDTIDLINSITTQGSGLQNQSSSMTQASWQMLFSFAGDPFTNTSSNGPDFDLNWGNMYTDYQGDSNFGL